MAQPSWKAELGFSDRLNVVSSIVLAYRRAHPNNEFSEAHLEATKIERNAFDSAVSRDDYQQKYQASIDELEKQEPHGHIVDTSEAPENLESSAVPEPAQGVQIGRYENAVHCEDGLFSTIYKSTDTAGKMIALKVTTPHQMSPPHDSERESRILKQLSDKNVIPLLDAFHEPGGHFVLVFPFLQLHLDDLLHQNVLTSRQIRSHLRDLFLALTYIHSLGVIHRDVKPSNILLHSANGPAYLADFGIAWSPDDIASERPTEKITDVGTTCYRPPEILFGDRSYGTSLDLWAAGCVVAEAVDTQHRQLFDSGPLGSELALIQSIFTTLGTPNAETWPSTKDLPDWNKVEFKTYPGKTWEEILQGVSSNGRDLVSKLVKYESSDRLSALEVLSHPYLADAS